MLTRDEIGRRAVREIEAGRVVNLGLGMPTPAASSIRREPRAMDPVALTAAGFELGEMAPGVDVDEVRAATGVALASPQLRLAGAGTDPAPATEGGRV